MQSSQEIRTYSLAAIENSPDDNLPMHQQTDPEVGCTQEVLESIIEIYYKSDNCSSFEK
jgi:hypothetical protein